MTVSLLALCPSCPFSNAVTVNLSQPKTDQRAPCSKPTDSVPSHTKQTAKLFRERQMPADMVSPFPLRPHLPVPSHSHHGRPRELPCSACNIARSCLEALRWPFPLPGRLFLQIPTGLALTPFRPLLNIAFSGHLNKTATPAPYTFYPSFLPFLQSTTCHPICVVHFIGSLSLQLDCKP